MTTFAPAKTRTFCRSTRFGPTWNGFDVMKTARSAFCSSPLATWTYLASVSASRLFSFDVGSGSGSKKTLKYWFSIPAYFRGSVWKRWGLSLFFTTSVATCVVIEVEPPLSWPTNASR